MHSLIPRTRETRRPRRYGLLLMPVRQHIDTALFGVRLAVCKDLDIAFPSQRRPRPTHRPQRDQKPHCPPRQKILLRRVTWTTPFSDISMETLQMDGSCRWN
jgi:hypothetical protein